MGDTIILCDIVYIGTVFPQVRVRSSNFMKVKFLSIENLMAKYKWSRGKQGCIMMSMYWRRECERVDCVEHMQNLSKICICIILLLLVVVCVWGVDSSGPPLYYATLSREDY